MQKFLLISTSVVILGLVALSIVDATQRQSRIDHSNQVLASFDRSIAEVDTAIYQAYVGRYQLEPTFNIEISSDGKRLFAQGSGQRRVELFPANESTFYNEYTEALITFDPPNRGHSERFMLQQINQLREGIRIHEA